eukprot:COSAG01_NODE_28038_length_670_cov_24.838879_1_plen_46_part_01
MAAIQPKPNRHDRQLWQPRRASRLNIAAVSANKRVSAKSKTAAPSG